MPRSAEILLRDATAMLALAIFSGLGNSACKCALGGVQSKRGAAGVIGQVPLSAGPTDLEVYVPLACSAIFMAVTHVWDDLVRRHMGAGRLTHAFEERTHSLVGALAAAAGLANGGVAEVRI